MPGKLDALSRKGATTNTLGFPLPNHQDGPRHTTGTPSFSLKNYYKGRQNNVQALNHGAWHTVGAH